MSIIEKAVSKLEKGAEPNTAGDPDPGQGSHAGSHVADTVQKAARKPRPACIGILGSSP